MSGRATVTITNDAEGTNFSQVSFNTNSILTPSQASMAAVGYCAQAIANSCAGGTRIRGCTFRTAGTAGALPVDFNLLEFGQILDAYLDAGLTVSTMTDYGQDLGVPGLGLAPIGTSVVMSERTLTPGRTGIGRHFFPFTTRDVVLTTGLLNPATGARLEQLYEIALMTPVPALGAFGASVTNSAGLDPKEIVSVKANSVLSNLRSRRR